MWIHIVNRLILCVCRFTCATVEGEGLLDVAKPLMVIIDDPAATDSSGEKRKATDGEKFGDRPNKIQVREMVKSPV